MANSEKGLWKYVSKGMKETNKQWWHAERIETGATACGQPDVNYCLFSKENNLELKYATSAKMCELRPTQYQWMKRRIKAGKTCWVLVEFNNLQKFALINSSHCKTLITEPNPKAWMECADIIWDKSIDWEQLTGVLRS